MNSVILLGNLTRDPEVRYSQSSNPIAVCNVGLAVKRRFAGQGQQDVDFINCVAFGKTAEFIEKYFKKGDSIAVQGELQIDTWDDNGTKKTAAKVKIDHCSFGGNKKSNNNTDAPSNTNNGNINVVEDDNDLPF